MCRIACIEGRPVGSVRKLQAVVASRGFPEEFAALLHSGPSSCRSICRPDDSFLQSSLAAPPGFADKSAVRL